MTPEDKKRIEVLGRAYAYPAEGSAADDVRFLLAQLDEAHAALRFYADGFAIMDHIDGTYTIRETWYEKARKALGESE